MIYVGIDVAKHTHYAAVMASANETLAAPFAFSNDRAGFSLLNQTLKDYPKNNLLIGLESTAHYGENLVCFLLAQGYQVSLVNPIQTASLRKSGIRSTKTDKVDAKLIVKALILGAGAPLRKQNVDIAALRGLCKARRDLVKMRSRCKTQLVALVDQLFPELHSFFDSGIHIKTSYELLKLHPRPCEIQKLHLTYLINFLRKHSRGKFSRENAVSLKALAAASVGVDNPVLPIQIRQTIQRIELFTQQLDDVDDAITQIMNRSASKLMTIPGVGAVNAAMILSGIGEISRFSHPSKLLAFAGLDPIVRQSGKFTARSSRMSKRGDSLLRYALVYAAHNVVRNNRTFADYYQAKVAQGKCHYNALGHVAGKLVRVIHAMLTRDLAFDLP
jgi:transposase